MESESIEELISKQQGDLGEPKEDLTALVNLGLSDQELNEAVEYIASSTQDIPKFMESFNKEKLKNITTIAAIAQLARIPGILKQINEINGIILKTNVYNNLEPEELIKMSNSMSNELRLILETSRKTIETLNTLDVPPSTNQKLIEQLLQMPEEDILAMREFVESKRHKNE